MPQVLAIAIGLAKDFQSYLIGYFARVPQQGLIELMRARVQGLLLTLTHLMT